MSLALLRLQVCALRTLDRASSKRKKDRLLRWPIFFRNLAMGGVVRTTTKFVSPKITIMRKNTKGRRIQHFPAVVAREAVAAHSYKEKVPNPATKSGFSTRTVKVDAVPAVKARRGKSIKHPHYPSVSSQPFTPKVVGYVSWKECAGAIRRGWK